MVGFEILRSPPAPLSRLGGRRGGPTSLPRLLTKKTSPRPTCPKPSSPCARFIPQKPSTRPANPKGIVSSSPAVASPLLLIGRATLEDRQTSQANPKGIASSSPWVASPPPPAGELPWEIRPPPQP